MLININDIRVTICNSDPLTGMSSQSYYINQIKIIMRNTKLLKINIAALVLIIISCGFIKNEKKDTKEEECKYIPDSLATNWNKQILNFPYKVYQHFNDIPFPKQLIDGQLPYPENKHILFYFGYKTGSKQEFFLFAVIGKGYFKKKNIKPDYSTLIYYDQNLKEWIDTDQVFFDEAKLNWKEIIENFGPLPTLYFTVPNVDLNVCIHKSFDRIRLGIDEGAEEFYKLKLYFFEADSNEGNKNFDACYPCPPTC